MAESADWRGQLSRGNHWINLAWLVQQSVFTWLQPNTVVFTRHKQKKKNVKTPNVIGYIMHGEQIRN